MPKATGGGGSSGGAIFTSNKVGDGSYGASLYIDLGLIPLGQRIWFGSGQYASPDKSGIFELRTNALTKSAGTDADTTLLGSISAGTRSGTVTQDYYKSGTISTKSVLGSGAEKVWLKIKSKTATLGSYYYSINYILE